MSETAQLAADLSIAWSSFAPEIAVTVAVVVLLGVTVAGRRRMWVAGPLGLVVAVVGMWLLAEAGATTGADTFVPGIVTVAAGIGLVAATFGLAGAPRTLHAWIAGGGVGVALVLTAWQAMEVLATGDGLAAVATMGGSVALDGVAVFTRLTVYLTTLFVIPMGHAYLADRNIHRPEFDPLLLLSAAGMALFGAANDLVTVFVALEILSIALYVLSGIARRDRRSQEAATKYFLMGAVASAVLLYGFALTYVVTGTLSLPGVATALVGVDYPFRLAAVAMVLVVVGIGFKVALVPFQLWTPDVYQGAPTNVTAFMGAATKAAGFAVLARLLLVAYAPLRDVWIPILAGMALLSMAYGAWTALRQTDVKRLLAYSAIAHAGYATIGILARSDEGLSATLWYLLTYAVSTLAGFAIVIAVERTYGRMVTLHDLRGLGRTSPFLAGALGLSLLSLAGIPPTIGFVGKLTLFTAGVRAGWTWLVVAAVVTSVVSAAYYLRLMVVMYLEEPGEDALEPAYSHGWNVAATASMVLVVVLGIQPGMLLDFAQRAAGLVQ